jgi:hypothetical protein
MGIGDSDKQIARADSMVEERERLVLQFPNHLEFFAQSVVFNRRERDQLANIAQWQPLLEHRRLQCRRISRQVPSRCVEVAYRKRFQPSTI